MNITDIDNQSRIRIASDTGSSFFVEAGAGSGKTTKLVERMVSMVRQGIDIRHICAITFTKAAAREFYGRFQKRLSEIISKTENNSERIKCTEALQNINLCFMGTIDAFSGLILREHPVEAGIPSDFSVCASNEMTDIYRCEYADLLKGEYGETMRKKAVFFDKLFPYSCDKFLSILTIINERRNTEFIYDIPVSYDIDEIFSEVKKDFLQVYGCIYNNTDSVHEKSIDKLDEMRKDYEKLKGKWSRMIPEVYAFFKNKNTVKIRKSPSSIGIEREDLFSYGRNVFSISLTDFGVREMITELRYSAAMDFVVSASEMIGKRLLEKGKLTFFESKLALRNMLKKDAENGGKLIKHIADRHRYFLLDEFQDTDPMQAEIFFYLAAKKPVPDWKKCVPRDGAIFIVGDPKQSIYRFRNADISSYSAVKKIFQNFSRGGVLELTRNFRSVNALKEKFNDIFTELLPKDTDNQSKFNKIPTDGGYDTDFGGIYTYKSKSEDDPIKICDIIELMVNDLRFSVPDKDGGKRCLDYSDFMVITRTKSNIPQIMSELNRRNIPCYVEGKTLFEECPALLAAEAVLKAAAYPSNELAVYSALRSGIFPISDSKLIFAKVKLSLFADNEQAFSANESIKQIFDTITLIRKKSSSMPFSALFGYTVDKLRLLGNTDDTELECLYFARELIRSEELNGNIANICDGADYLAKLITDSEQERSLSFETKSPKVHIANLHKVKGLESTVVILANASKNTKSPNIRTEYTDYGNRSYVFKCNDKSFFPVISTKKFPEQMLLEEESAQAESIRLIYVAATRAKSALIVSESGFWNDISKLSDGDIFSRYPPVTGKIKAVPKIISAEILYQNAECVLDNSSSYTQSYKISLPSKLKLKSVIAENDDYKTAETQKNPALAGTLIHKLMECVVSSENTCDSDKLADEIIQNYDAPQEYKNLLTNVYFRLMNGGFEQTNGSPEDIISELKNAEEKYCELPFCYKKSEKIIEHGIIDLLYKKEGMWYVVDYKTTHETKLLDEKYEEQLTAYQRAVEQMTGEPAKAFIYHIESEM